MKKTGSMERHFAATRISTKFSLAKAIVDTLFVSFAVIAFGLAPAKAGMITSGCANTNLSCTLAELFSGGSISIEGIRFDGWNLIDERFPGPLDFSNFDVFGIEASIAHFGIPTLSFLPFGQLSVENFETGGLVFRFSATSLDPLFVISESGMQIGGGFSGGTLTEVRSVIDPVAVTLETFAEFGDVGQTIRSQYDDFAAFPAQTTISSQLEVSMVSSRQGERASVNMSQGFGLILANQIPEPTTLAILGLVGLGVMRRRRAA